MADVRERDVELALHEVLRLISVANDARADGIAADSTQPPGIADAETQLEARFRVSQNFAVYGTLAPRRPNHHVIADIVGEWIAGVVEGELSQVGWGATLGYPAFRPIVGGAAIPVHVLTSNELPGAWARLDTFEGAEYRRILVPVFAVGTDERRLLTVANLYGAA